MDIRKWPFDRIMQLPDHCFGQRYLVTIEGIVADAPNQYFISKGTLPEQCVVWGVTLATVAPEVVIVGFLSFGLSDVLPTSVAEFAASDVFIRGLGFEWLNRPALIFQNHMSYKITLRQHVYSASRRIVAELTKGGAMTGEMFAAFEISSIPTEVPDCLLSAHP